MTRELPSMPKFPPSHTEFVRASWGSWLMQHRYEDLALIREIVLDAHPLRMVELGTAEGGFAAMLADLTASWKGQVLTVDIAKLFDDRLLPEHENPTFLQADCLSRPHSTIQGWISQPYSALYTDNGNKMQELQLYAPLLSWGSLLGTHDYGTEVNPYEIEPFLANLGYRPWRHEEFLALTCPDYPVSLTRFWRRGAFQ